MLRHTEESRRKIGEATRRLWQDPEHRAKMAESNKKMTPARWAHIAKVNADPVLNAKRAESARRTGAKRRGFEVPPEKIEDYKIIRKKLSNSREAGRVLGLIE